MKVALIGNMNNNNFALMRYWRDLGVDAHLLLNSNDGRGNSKHFDPECDTWNIARWHPYIHQTDISENIISSFDFPVSWMLSFRSYLRSLINEDSVFCPPVSRRAIRNSTAGYSHVIGSGIAPAALARIGKPLDIFYPYSIGVEYAGAASFKIKRNSSNWFTRKLARSVLEKQKDSIKKAAIVINPERSLTEIFLRQLNICSLPLFIPMLYNKEPFPDDLYSDQSVPFSRILEGSRFILLSHARLIWSRPSSITSEDWVEQNKNSDWLIQAFKQFLSSRAELKPILILFEYGPDVDATKALCIDLGISDSVYWFPVTDRKSILWLISKVDIGVGEFYDLPRILWGGTGIEVLAMGKPLLQGFNFADHEFENIYGVPPPPILAVRKQDDIYEHLIEMADFPLRRVAIGKASMQWFDQYNGVGLAKKWLDVLGELDTERKGYRV